MFYCTKNIFGDQKQSKSLWGYDVDMRTSEDRRRDWGTDSLGRVLAAQTQDLSLDAQQVDICNLSAVGWRQVGLTGQPM